METFIVQVSSPKVVRLLHELEALKLIKVLKNPAHTKTKLSEKYKGVFSKKDAKSFNEHTRKMRNEWDTIS